MGGYILIAGKEEGFEYRDGLTQRFETKSEVKIAISTLIILGYKIFVVSEIIERIDEFIKEAK